MNARLLALALGTVGLSFAQSTVAVATVTSRAPIRIQGVEAPVVGSTAWPVAAGDVIQTGSAPAELRMNDGTRVFVPASSRFVLGSASASSTGTRADVGVRAAAAAPRVSPGQPQKGLVNNVANLLNGGAMLVAESAARQQLALPPVEASTSPGAVPVTLSLSALAKAYAPYNPIIAVIAQALKVPTSVIQLSATGSYYITGFQINVNGTMTAGTIVINPPSASNPTGSIVVYNTTLTPTTPTPPAPVLTVTPPPAGSGSPPLGCKGGSLSPSDVSNGIPITNIFGSC